MNTPVSDDDKAALKERGLTFQDYRNVLLRTGILSKSQEENDKIGRIASVVYRNVKVIG
jgi:hypothetical protein